MGATQCNHELESAKKKGIYSSDNRYLEYKHHIPTSIYKKHNGSTNPDQIEKDIKLYENPTNYPTKVMSYV